MEDLLNRKVDAGGHTAVQADRGKHRFQIFNKLGVKCYDPFL